VAVSVDRRDLCEGARGRAHSLHGDDNAMAVNTDGRREVLGVAIGPSEAVLEELPELARRPRPARGQAGHRRRPQGIGGGRVEDLPCYCAAVPRSLDAHLLTHAPAAQRPAVTAMVKKTIFAQETAQEARAQWKMVADALRERAPKLASMIDASQGDVLAFAAFPKEHWPQISSTNPLERLNGEINRRSDVVGIFPNDRAIAPPTMLPIIRRAIGMAAAGADIRAAI